MFWLLACFGHRLTLSGQSEFSEGQPGAACAALVSPATIRGFGLLHSQWPITGFSTWDEWLSIASRRFLNCITRLSDHYRFFQA